jgi:uncharacterized membrane protein YvbJ
MGQKSCEKCGELVDEAKAFCPACGNSFVEEEQRGQASAFEKMDNTVQMGQTMYGKMLSDMGLNISKAPDAAPQPEKRVEVVAPIATNVAPAAHPAPNERTQTDQSAKKNYLIWIIIGAAALVVLLAILVVVIAVVFFYLNR